jgi:predicted metal-dependent HD superfamily phosphohydrolase
MAMLSLKDRTVEILTEMDFVNLNVTIVWKDIITRYSETHRKYHTLDHIEQMFDVYDRIFWNYRYLPLEAAILFHDIIYDPKLTDNEKKSADYVKALMVKRSYRSSLAITCDMIENTDYANVPNPYGMYEEFLRDFDFYIFSSSIDNYKLYTQQIREEYSFIEDKIFFSNRAKFLIKLLQRDKIYYTKQFSRYEEDAKNNIANELNHIIDII